MSGDGETTAAFEDADRAARASGVEVRELVDLDDLDNVCRLYQRVWAATPDNPPMTREILRAVAKAGSYVSGAFSTGELVGACVGFFAEPASVALHSHIMGVSDVARGRSMGYTLKLHQRAWCLERGVSSVAWTFDPLVRRNAHFNLTKLAAGATEYLQNFYGGGHDGLNGDDETDRLLVNWELSSAVVAAACRGEHAELDASELVAQGATVALACVDDRPRAGSTAGQTVLVAVPGDIEILRTTDPALAGEWRHALRDALGSLMATGARVTGFDRQGWFVLEQGRTS